MALHDIVPRRQPRAYIKWGYSQVLYLTYTTGTFKKTICQFRDIEGMSLELTLISHCTKMKVLVFLSSDILFEKCIKLNLNKWGDDLLSSSPAIKKYPW